MLFQDSMQQRSAQGHTAKDGDGILAACPSAAPGTVHTAVLGTVHTATLGTVHTATLGTVHTATLGTVHTAVLLENPDGLYILFS